MRYGKIKYTADDAILFCVCISIHIFSYVTAQVSDKLIHVCHIFVLIPFLVYGAVNNAVRLPLYGKSQVCKQYRYPEFLENGVLGIAPEISEPDLFFDKLIILLHRPSKEVTLAEQLFGKVKIICDQRFHRPTWEVKFKDAYFPAIKEKDIVTDSISIRRYRECINIRVKFSP